MSFHYLSRHPLLVAPTHLPSTGNILTHLSLQMTPIHLLLFVWHQPTFPCEIHPSIFPCGWHPPTSPNHACSTFFCWCKAYWPEENWQQMFLITCSQIAVALNLIHWLVHLPWPESACLDWELPTVPSLTPRTHPLTRKQPDNYWALSWALSL